MALGTGDRTVAQAELARGDRPSCGREPAIELSSEGIVSAGIAFRSRALWTATASHT